jgi:hypothetical protein
MQELRAMARMDTINIRITRELAERLDNESAGVPRDRFVRRILEDWLGGTERTRRRPDSAPLNETIMQAEKAVVAAQARPVVEPARRALSSRAAKSGVKPIERG